MTRPRPPKVKDPETIEYIAAIVAEGLRRKRRREAKAVAS